MAKTKIQFKDLSWPLQVGVIGGFMDVCFFALGAIIGIVGTIISLT